MISIREYAEQQKVGYEGVRKKVTKLEKQGVLDGHIEVIDGTRYLDDKAIEILNQTRKKMLVIEYAENVSNENAQIKEQVLQLQQQRIEDLEKINEANKKLYELSEELSKLKVEQAKLESTNKALLENKERSKQDLQAITEAKVKSEMELQQAQESNTKLQSELEDKAQEIQEQAEELASYHKTVFGLYRKDKRG